jgi:hypothetical protein
MLVFRLQMNRSQWNKAKERYALSQRNAIEAGKFIGPTPLGYVRRGGRLQEHPKLGKVIRQAYRRAARDGLHAAMAYLQEEVPERNWTTDSARKVLASRVYLGEAWMWVQENGKRARKVNPAAHAALTTLDDWTAAQVAPRERKRNGEYPLSGIARCATCGGSLVGQLQWTPSERRYRRYRCASKGCGGGSSISADKLEEHVRDTLEAALADSRFRLRFVPGDLDQARETVELAKAEREAYLIRTSALSDGFQAGAEKRDLDVQRAEAAYREVAGQAARSEVLPAAGELHKPGRFARALAVMVDRIEVRPGRGSVKDRVRIDWANPSAKK